jgi:16S rRNA G966 N2-methylase RsmD
VDELRVLCAQIPGNRLVAAECKNLTGGIPDENGVATCQRLDGVAQSAYLSVGLRCLAEAETVPELGLAISQIWTAAMPPPDSFRIEFLRLGGADRPGKTECILAAANAIPARPNLAAPQQRYAIVAQPRRLWFGAILSEGQHGYRLHESKPYRTSNSLPARLARAVLNLVSPPAGSILDPFCGTGSILLEAAALGLTAYGLDRNIKMVGMTRRNLAHFGYSAQAVLGDAAQCTQVADAIVTDLPYGRLLEQDTANLLPILQHLRGLAHQAIFITEENLTPLLVEAGYRAIQVLPVRKRHGMSRIVHRAESG